MTNVYDALYSIANLLAPLILLLAAVPIYIVYTFPFSTRDKMWFWATRRGIRTVGYYIVVTAVNLVIGLLVFTIWGEQNAKPFDYTPFLISFFSVPALIILPILSIWYLTGKNASL